MCNFYWILIRYVVICIIILYFYVIVLGKMFLCYDILVGEIYEWIMKWLIKVLNVFDLIIGCIRNF